MYEESQMVGKLLARSTKTRQEAALITEVVDPKTGLVVTSRDEIAQAFMEHYQQLYTTEYVVGKNSIQSYFEGINLPRLSNSLVEQIQLDITSVEILAALNLIAGAKACGNDRLPIEFYKKFAKELAPFLTNLFNCVKNGGAVPSVL